MYINKSKGRYWISNILFLLIVFTAVNTFTIFSNVSALALNFLCLLIIIVSLTIKVKSDGWAIMPRFDYLLISFLLFIVLMSFSTSHVDFKVNRDTILYVNFSLLPFLTYVAVTLVYSDSNKKFYGYTAFFGIVFILYKTITASSEITEEVGRLVQVNWGNIGVAMFPITLLVSNRKVRFISFLVVLSVALFSLKRSGYLIIFMASFWFLFLVLINKAYLNRKLKLLVLVLILCFSLIVSSQYESIEYLYTAIERIRNIQEDGGSGRLEIWAMAFDYWRLSSSEHIIAGYSFSSFNNLTGYTLAAVHNDALDVLLDYGVLGFIAFVLFLGRYLLVSFILSMKDKNMAFFSIFVFSNVLVYSQVAGLYHFSQMFLSVFVCFAILETKVLHFPKDRV